MRAAFLPSKKTGWNSFVKYNIIWMNRIVIDCWMLHNIIVSSFRWSIYREGAEWQHSREYNGSRLLLLIIFLHTFLVIDKKNTLKIKGVQNCLFISASDAVSYPLYTCTHSTPEMTSSMEWLQGKKAIFKSLSSDVDSQLSALQADAYRQHSQTETWM